MTWNGSGSQQSSAQRPPIHHPPPITRPSYTEENIDMMRNKENSYQRSPLRKYENTYAKRKDFEQESRVQFQSSSQQANVPVTVNLNTNEHSQNGSLPATVTIPIDSQVNRNGDKISVNIDLRVVDLENAQQQQQQTTSHPQWSGGDPLDLHIRKLERNIEQVKT